VDLDPGTLIDKRFEVISKLGGGGMGDVYLIEDLQLQRQKRAIKILHPHIAKELRNIERFRQEMLLSCELSHPNIIRFYEFGETEKGQYYMTMEYLDGQTVGDIIDNEKEKLSFERTLVVLYYVAGALHHIHCRNIVHRDIKPSNILIGKNGEVKLTDLGIAKSLVSQKKITRTNEMVGTATYMSPEQFTEGKVDFRSDIYSFGIMAFEMVNGECPFEDENYVSLMAKHLSKPIPPVAPKGGGIPSWYQKFIEKCAAKSANDRYQSMAEIVEYLFNEISKLNIRVTEPKVILGGDEGRPAIIESKFSKGVSSIARTLRISKESLINGAVALFYAYLFLFLFTPIPKIPLSGILESKLNFGTMDLFFRIRGERPPPKDVIIVSLDEETFDKLNANNSPVLPRQYLAEALENIAKDSPKKVIVDLRFSDLMEASSDERLANAFSLSPTFIAWVKVEDPGNKNALELHPNEYFSSKAKGLFLATLRKTDSIARKFFFEKKEGLATSPMAEIIYNDKADSKALPGSDDFINYFGHARTIQRVSLYTVIDKAHPLPKEYFKDKYILVGTLRRMSTPNGGSDTHESPTDKYMPGVEIHATTLSNILEKNWIKRAPLLYECFFFPVGGFFVVFLLLNQNRKKRASLVAIFGVGWVTLAYLLFTFDIYLPPIGLPLLLIATFIPLRAKSVSEKAIDSFWEV